MSGPDHQGLIRTLNAAVEKMFGFAGDELIGRNVNVLMPEPFHSRHDGYIRHHLETGERKIIGIARQVMARRRNGAIFPVHLSVSAFESDGRKFFTGILHDLSEQRAGGATTSLEIEGDTFTSASVLPSSPHHDLVRKRGQRIGDFFGRVGNFGRVNTDEFLRRRNVRDGRPIQVVVEWGSIRRRPNATRYCGSAGRFAIVFRRGVGWKAV